MCAVFLPYSFFLPINNTFNVLYFSLYFSDRVQCTRARYRPQAPGRSHSRGTALVGDGNILVSNNGRRSKMCAVVCKKRRRQGGGNGARRMVDGEWSHDVAHEDLFCFPIWHPSAQFHAAGPSTHSFFSFFPSAHLLFIPFIPFGLFFPESRIFSGDDKAALGEGGTTATPR